MLDLRFIRENADIVKKGARNKGESVDIDRILELDEEKRSLSSQVDDLKGKRNKVSKEIGKLKKEGQDASLIVEEMKKVSDTVKKFDDKIRVINSQLQKLLMWVPNIPDSSAPVGSDESSNVVIKNWGEKPTFDFVPLPHWDIGERLQILDMARASKIAGSGFAMFMGVGAKLQRALVAFMIDLHIEKHGYTEVFPPFMVNREAMTGTGQLPKLEEDMYLCEEDDLFLIPTAEVPVTNIYKDEILKGEDLPIYLTSYTACFRREAGSYGKDTRGLIRVHQFDKVEMVKFVLPEESPNELESLLGNAEEVLQLLRLPYRVVELSTGDLSFAAYKCYDIEVWASGVKRFLEVSSCSTFTDFQARRANIRFRREDGAKVEFVHTLNGSGLALPRTVIAIMENYQQKDGSIVIPDVLRDYMGGLERIVES